MSFELPKLGFERNALAPHMSEETLNLHYGKHHQTYVTNLNNLVAGSEFEGKTVEEIILASAGKDDKVGFFNNAGQHWNHSFFWNCLTPNGGGAIPADLEAKLIEDFGSIEKFKEEFSQACITQFGSGWGWLVFENGSLKITKTSNADTPMTKGQTALLTCDVWEHAYYVDYQNRRPDFVATFLDNLVNWEFVADCYRKAAA